MEIPSEINIIKDFYKSELKEKSSRFTALAFPAENEEEALSFLNKTRKEYYDASHHCYAYKFPGLFKYSDAGEPSGTAGIRIMNAIDHFDLVNIILIVVRYFGGTKLGVGGLGRAYYESAFNLLEKTEIIKKLLYKKVFIETELQLVQKVYHLFKNTENKIVNVEYSGKALFECLVKPGNLAELSTNLTNFTNGMVNIIPKENIYN